MQQRADPQQQFLELQQPRQEGAPAAEPVPGAHEEDPDFPTEFFGAGGNFLPPAGREESPLILAEQRGDVGIQDAQCAIGQEKRRTEGSPPHTVRRKD